jgi:hypothetical protein
MPWVGSFEALEHHLRHFRNMGDDPPHDTNGVLILLRALADNLRENAVPDALRELAETITPEQAAFLASLAAWAKEHHQRRLGG